MITELNSPEPPDSPKRGIEQPVVDVRHLSRSFDGTDAVKDLSFTVRAGSVFGFFGRNGAGKTTTIKCLLNLLRPTSGSVRLFGLDPAHDELAIKRRIAYVPDSAAFYPWMTVRHTLDYFASFRESWDVTVEAELLERFRLDPRKRADTLSKGQGMQLALVTAICPGPELLILDEPTTGLDPIVRREFVEAVVGAYQDADPENRTIFVSTHLISEFEGLVDDFTIVENGEAVLACGADDARNRFRRIRARFSAVPPEIKSPDLVEVRQHGRELELVVSDSYESVVHQIQSFAPEAITVEALDLESIFVALLNPQGQHA
jgi:ABC-2 type transport system ATP-binding protein